MAQTELAYYYTAIAQRATLSHYSLDTATVIQTKEESGGASRRNSLLWLQLNSNCQTNQEKP